MTRCVRVDAARKPACDKALRHIPQGFDPDAGMDEADAGDGHCDGIDGSINSGRIVRRITARLERLGYQVQLTPTTPVVTLPSNPATVAEPAPEPKRKRGRPRKSVVVEIITPPGSSA